MSESIARVETDVEPPRRREVRRYVGRALLTSAMAAAICYWIGLSLFFLVFRCGDNCDGTDAADHWRYPAQFVLTASGGVLGLIALPLGFTKAQGAYRVLRIASLGCALAWLYWVFILGGF